MRPGVTGWQAIDAGRHQAQKSVMLAVIRNAAGRRLAICRTETGHDPLRLHWPATCRAVTLRRYQTLIVAMEMTEAASTGSSSCRAAASQISLLHESRHGRGLRSTSMFLRNRLEGDREEKYKRIRPDEPSVSSGWQHCHTYLR